MKNSVKNLVIDDITIQVVRKNIKNINLTVRGPEGMVRMSVPRGVDDHSINAFVRAKLSWIKKHKTRLESREKPPVREYITGEVHGFLGKMYRLKVIEVSHQQEQQRVVQQGECLEIYVQPEHTKEKREALLYQWYREQLKKLIPHYINKWEPVMGVKVHQWGIKRMKTRWGTCNIQAKRIWINLELARKRPECLEYIVVHELAHLLERHHNQRFKGLMDQFLPQWRDFRGELSG
ncbi:M48 family metallopeptidase [Anoxynatronum buryatiense]|uniref:YgjP-like metallopeptidase domain-containing protein n=1 Tax=Anoxynatronum buryatiense TaxID=489973 RepID=A0AA45WXF6_9CLOT|nr:SprT family zinc-dependent metalloprotease [Anoxynatronum buryatiense]SMP63632.1 hypothetical protein SAMN06296020_11148 [Anoxynatronum buryatiense]